MDSLLKVMLTILYLLWLPAMLLGRAMGRDPLQLKKPPTSSYWLVRRNRGSRESYFSEHSENEGRLTHREGIDSGARVGATGSPIFARFLRAVAKPFASDEKASPAHEPTEI